MSRLRFAFICALCVFGMSLYATEYFVDVTRPDDSGDGLSEATAKHTIQAAVALARNDDVVTVLPGVYKEGSGVDGTIAARVVLTNRVWLRSSGGKHKTFIVGEKAATETGQGTGELRCVYVSQNGGYSMIEGFTICGGAASGTGGGVYGYYPTYTYVMDCIISNNVAKQAAGIYRAAAVKCLITGNTAAGSGSPNGAAMFEGRAYNSLICRNSGGSSVLNHCAGLVNCTVVENTASGVFMNKATPVYNSILVGNSGIIGPTAGTQPNLYNSVVNVGQNQFGVTNDYCKFEASTYQLTAPAFDDWRPLSTADAVGRGSVDYDTTAMFPFTNGKASWKTYLENNYLHVDYEGNPIPTEGAIDCGCVQGAVTPASGRVRFKFDNSSPGRFEAFGVPLRCANSYAYSETWPTQFCVRPFFDSGKTTFMYRIEPDLAGFDCRFPEMDGWFRLTAPPLGTNVAVTAFGAVQELYVDKARGSDANGGTSTNDAFRTIQAAVDAASGNYYTYTVVHVAPGWYDEGGGVMNGLSNRVAVYKKTLRIVADEGPEKTFIVGAGDPDTESGLGTNAVRCASWDNGGNMGCLQGFTLTGGRTAAGYVGSEYKPGYGGVFHDAAGDQVCDCIISNNIAYCGGVNVGGKLLRCRIYDNTSTYRGVFWNGVFISCDMAGNVAKDSAAPSVVWGGNVFFSTVMDGGYDYGAKFTGCIVDNRDASKPRNFTADGCVIVGAAPAGQTGCVVVTKPKFISKTDHHLRPSSPAIGAADVSKPDVAYSYFSSDLDGNALYFANGNPTAGAYQVPDWTYNEPRPFVIYFR